MNFNLNNCDFAGIFETLANFDIDRHIVNRLLDQIELEARGDTAGIYAGMRLHPLQSSGIVYNPATDEYIGFQMLKNFIVKDIGRERPEISVCPLPEYDSNYFASLKQLTLDKNPGFLGAGKRLTVFCFRYSNLYAYGPVNTFQGSDSELHAAILKKERENQITNEVVLPQYDALLQAGYDLVYHVNNASFTLLKPSSQITRCTWIETPVPSYYL